MWFYMKLAWRNIFRNKRRTIIAGIAIGISLAALIFIDALMIGMRDSVFRSATHSFLGEAQIHADHFRESNDVIVTIKHYERLVQDLKKEAVVSSFTSRVLSLGMLTSPANVSSVMLIGVVPETERFLSKIDDAVREGSFFEGSSEQDMVIGSNLAEVLELQLGDRVVATVAQAGSGDLSQEMFRISGIYHFGIREMENGMAFVRLPRAQKMLAIGNEVHQIAVQFINPEYIMMDTVPFLEKYTDAGNEAVAWTTLLPQLKAVFDMTGISRAVMVIILMIVVIFGIINTLFMSLYERLFEFGVLRAVGTRPAGTAKLMLLEAGGLGVLSLGIGIVLSLVVLGILSRTGIDYRGIEFAGSVVQEIIYPVLKFYQYLVYPLGVFLFTCLVGIYPAVVAARMSISEALRKSL